MAALHALRWLETAVRKGTVRTGAPVVLEDSTAVEPKLRSGNPRGRVEGYDLGRHDRQGRGGSPHPGRPKLGQLGRPLSGPARRPAEVGWTNVEDDGGTESESVQEWVLGI